MVKSFIISLVIVILYFGCKEVPMKKTILAQKGILDLTNVSFQETEIVNLDGDWDFYWKKFLSYEEILENKNKPDLYLKVPGVWNGTQIKAETLTGEGYCTYHLLVKLSHKYENLAIRIPIIETANAVWINDTLVYQAGKVGKTKEEMDAYILREIKPVTQNAQNEFHITVHVSNFMNRTGGVVGIFYFGKLENLYKKKVNATISDMIILGSLFIMGIYHIALFLIRKKDKSPLYFGFFCIDYTLRLLITDERILLTTFPSIPFDITYRLEYLTAFILLPLFVSFLNHLFAGKIHTYYIRIITVFAFGITASVLLLPHSIYTRFLLGYEILILFSIPYLLYINIVAVKEKLDGAAISFLGVVLLAVGSLLDILQVEHFFYGHYIFPFTLFGFLFFQAFSISTKFSKAFDLSEHQAIELSEQKNTLSEINTELTVLQKDLESKVKLRGEELEIIYNQNLLEIQKATDLEKEIAVHKEREELFVDIHDNLGGKLLSLSFLLKSMEPNKVVSQELKLKIVETIDEILKGLRNHLLAFEDITLIEKNFMKGFTNFLVRRYSTAERKIQIEIKPNAKPEQISKKYYHHLFSILQELINNDLKYGEKTTRWIIDHNKDSISFQMIANSKYKVGKVQAGNGRKTIRERLKQMPFDFSEKLEKGIYTSQLTIGLSQK